jgi:hypothetical protein
MKQGWPFDRKLADEPSSAGYEENRGTAKLLYTEREIANMTGFTIASLRFRRSRGVPLFPFRQIGRSIRYNLDDVIKTIENYPKIQPRGKSND